MIDALVFMVLLFYIMQQILKVSKPFPDAQSNTPHE